MKYENPLLVLVNPLCVRFSVADDWVRGQSRTGGTVWFRKSNPKDRRYQENKPGAGAAKKAAPTTEAKQASPAKQTIPREKQFGEFKGGEKFQAAFKAIASSWDGKNSQLDLSSLDSTLDDSLAAHEIIFELMRSGAIESKSFSKDALKINVKNADAFKKVMQEFGSGAKSGSIRFGKLRMEKIAKREELPSIDYQVSKKSSVSELLTKNKEVDSVVRAMSKYRDLAEVKNSRKKIKGELKKLSANLKSLRETLSQKPSGPKGDLWEKENGNPSLRLYQAELAIDQLTRINKENAEKSRELSVESKKEFFKLMKPKKPMKMQVVPSKGEVEPGR